eukprot:TRINITY_DN5832_c0_g1_i2.p1 TRINITY_DN5832_c0_g1~~TRINITY_DN5832_c0_g1_i2.p1  ORF type:complete len:302 (+),score=69.87 TRINITY_DN5832_c0_g1_i2:52-957(+)
MAVLRLLLVACSAAWTTADVVTPCGHTVSDLVVDAQSTGSVVQHAVQTCRHSGKGPCLQAVGEAWASLATLEDDAIDASGVCGIWGKGMCFNEVKTTADAVQDAAVMMDSAYTLCNATSSTFDGMACAKTVVEASVDLVTAALHGYNSVQICAGGDQHSCLADVLWLINEARNTSTAVVHAATSCASKDKYPACMPAIDIAVRKLAATLSFGFATADRCGLISVTPCVKDINDCVVRLGTVGAQLNATASACHAGFSLSCAENLVVAGANVVSIGIDIVKVTTDCQSGNSTFARKNTPSLP